MVHVGARGETRFVVDQVNLPDREYHYPRVLVHLVDEAGQLRRVDLSFWEPGDHSIVPVGADEILGTAGFLAHAMDVLNNYPTAIPGFAVLCPGNSKKNLEAIGMLKTQDTGDTIIPRGMVLLLDLDELETALNITPQAASAS